MQAGQLVPALCRALTHPPMGPVRTRTWGRKLEVTVVASIFATTGNALGFRLLVVVVVVIVVAAADGYHWSD